MNEHIKTGKEIAKKVSYGYECDKNDEWVSLSWLKEEIKKRKLGMPDVLSKSQDYSLDWVLSLSEEK